MIKNLDTREIFIVESDEQWGHPVEVDLGEWVKYQALRDEFLALNEKFVEIADTAQMEAIARRPKTGHARSECPNGGFCGDCRIEGNEEGLWLKTTL